MPVGRTKELTDGKRCMVYLDSDCRRVALILGKGNVSRGIRHALKMMAAMNRIDLSLPPGSLARTANPFSETGDNR